ncbi:large ribosomal subunit protein uL11m-like [Watersipora subatra]|uniref:large ribosomal subunit protein uL11m-like n=1 Tax=Watersipora subatra TaxID=2589382 RepID=UPI00355AE54D
MASKIAGKLAKAGKKTKIVHTPYLKVTIPANGAKPAPPLGPQLGQRGINLPQFCKEFNAKTAHIKDDYPIPTGIHINIDKTFSLDIHTPSSSFLLKKAAGAPKGAMHPGSETAGMLSVKHIYELAKVKAQDLNLDGASMETICKMLIGQSRSLGIKVVKQLDTEDYREFLENRKLEIEEQNKEIEEKKAAKMLRL